MSASVAKTVLTPQSPSLAPAVEASAAKRELRVLQVFSVLSVGGAETWLMALLKYFREGADQLPVKVKCDILLTGGEPSVFDEEATALGARLFYVPFSRRHPIKFMREFRRILGAGQYDVIHDHQDYIAGLHFAMGMGRLPPVRVAHVHSAISGRASYAKSGLRKTTIATGKRMLRLLATNILGTSRQSVTDYGFDNSAFRGVGVVHCGFDTERFRGERRSAHGEICCALGWPESAKIILFAGRLDGDDVVVNGRVMSQKNAGFAIEVAKECITRDESVRLLMAGSGAQRKKQLEASLDGWGIGERVRIQAEQVDIARLMLGSDLLLFPSLAEGLGMVVVEAQAAGLRVLASDTTPSECVVVRKLVDFAPLTDAAEWADQALRLLNSAPLDSEECNGAVNRSPFSIENSAARLLDIYRG
jgi:glycosyltransferase involved in cell wall biosynthesis